MYGCTLCYPLCKASVYLFLGTVNIEENYNPPSVTLFYCAFTILRTSLLKLQAYLEAFLTNSLLWSVKCIRGAGVHVARCNARMRQRVVTAPRFSLDSES